MRAPGHPLQMVLGPAAWLVWFCVVYGGVGVACSVATPGALDSAFNAVNGGLLLLTLLTAAALAAAAWRCARATRQRPADERVVPWSATLLYGISSVSTLAVGLPLLVLPPCV